MAGAITLSKYEKVENALASMKNTAANLREKLEGTVPQIVGTAEVFGGAVGGGFIDQAWGTPDATTGVSEHKVMSVPTNLGIGGLLIIGGAVRVAGKSSNHLWDLGKGFLAAYGSNLGRTLGYDYVNKINPVTGQ